MRPCLVEMDRGRQEEEGEDRGKEGNRESKTHFNRKEEIIKREGDECDDKRQYCIFIYVSLYIYFPV